MGKPGSVPAEAQWSGVFFGRVVAFCQARWKWILTATCVTGIGAVYYAATHLSINSDPDALFSARLAFRRHAAIVEGAFPALRRQLVIVIDGDSPAVAHRAAGLLADHLTRDVTNFQGVYAPGSGEFFDRNGLLFLTVEELEELADRLAWAQPFLAELAREPTLPKLLSLLEQSFDAADSSTLSSREWSETLALIAAGFGSSSEAQPGPIAWENWAFGGGGLTRNIRLVLAEPRLDFENLEPTRAALDRIRALAAALDLDAEHGVRVRITGDLALAAEELGALRSEAPLLGVASFAWVTIVLVAGLGSIRLAVATLATLAVGLAWTSGLAAAAVGSLNLLSVSFAVLFIGLGIDFGIHFAIRTLTFLHEGKEPADALRAAAERAGPTLAACAVTTALGFFAFLPTSYRGIAELGLIAGIGIFVSLGATLVVFPALAYRVGFRGRPNPAREPAAAASRPPRGARLAVCSGALLLVVLAVPTLPDLRFDPDPLNVRDPNSEAVRAFRELVAAGPVSPWTAELVEADLDRAVARASLLEALPEVRRALTLDSFVPDAQTEKLEILSDMTLFLGDIRPRPAPPVDPERAEAALESLIATLNRWLRQPPDEPVAASVRALLASAREALARFQLSPDDYRDVERFQARVIGDLPDWLDRLDEALQASPVAREDLPSALRARFITPDGRARIQVLAERDLSAPGEIERFVDAVSAVAPRASGSAVRIVESARAVTRSLRQAFLYAVLAIALTLFALWRRGFEVLAALAVLALAALYTAASSIWLGVPLNFANVVALPLLLGIGVDTAIHLLAERRVQSLVSTRAARRAVTLSALTTLGSFGCLGFSSHPGLASLGQLLALGLAWVLVVNLWILPVFHAFEKP